jgi:hypothetical protein
MNRRRVAALLAVVAVCASACKKEPPAPPGATPPTAAPTAAAEPDDAAGRIVITDEVVNRYLSYWDQNMQLVQRVIQEVDQTVKEAEAKGEVRGGVHALSRAQDIERRLERDSEKLRREFRFTQGEVEQLQDFFSQLAVNLQLAKELPVAQMIAGMREQLQAVPADQRAEAEREISRLEADLEARSELRELRQAYGDRSVDTALGHKDRILKMQQRQLELLGNTR